MLKFDPAFWEEDLQGKIVVYYPRNELKILWEEKSPLPSRNRNTTDFLPGTFWQIFHLRLLLDFLAVKFAYSVKNFLSYLKITNLP